MLIRKNVNVGTKIRKNENERKKTNLLSTKTLEIIKRETIFKVALGRFSKFFINYGRGKTSRIAPTIKQVPTIQSMPGFYQNKSGNTW